MTKRMVLALVLLCGLGASAAVVIAARGAHGSSRPGLFRFSSRGARITPSRGAKKAFRVQSMRLLAVRDGRAFYELDTTDGRCFGVGSASTLGDPGGEACAPGDSFPAASRPLLDFSVYESHTTDRGAMTLFRIEGFAADGVASVGIANRPGHIALRVPVVDNLYVLSHVPPGLSGTIVPLDAGGSEIAGPSH